MHLIQVFGSQMFKLFTLQVEDIAYFYSENKVTFAVTKQNREFFIDLSLDKLMEQLDPDVFFRSNRQRLLYFLNKNKQCLPLVRKKFVIA